MGAPKPSVAPAAYSTLSQLSHPTKKITGTLPLMFLGRVTKVRSLSPRLLLTQSYRTSALAKCSRFGGCCARSAGARQSAQQTPMDAVWANMLLPEGERFLAFQTWVG